MEMNNISITLAGQLCRLPGHPEDYHYECDYFAIDLKTGQSYWDRYENSQPIDKTAFLFAVAESSVGNFALEGMRRIAIEVMTKWLIKVSSRLSPQERLIRGIEEANYQIWRIANYEDERQVLGASLAVAMIEGSMLYVAQLGNATAFIMRNGRIQRLPTQAPPVGQNEMVRGTNYLPPLQIELGYNKTIYPNIVSVELQLNDIVFLATDVVLDQIKLTELLQVLGRNVYIPITCQELVNSIRQSRPDREFALALAQFSGDGLVLHPNAAELTKTFRYYSHQEESKTVKDPTLELSSIKRESLTENASLQPEEGVHRTTLGGLKDDISIDQYEYKDEILAGFKSTGDQLNIVEQALTAQLRSVKSMIEWAEKHEIMDGKLFNSYLKLELAIKRWNSLRDAVEESAKEFPAKRRN